jgi:soluble lytic murein transglycosylase-like protein
VKVAATAVRIGLCCAALAVAPAAVPVAMAGGIDVAPRGGGEPAGAARPRPAGQRLAPVQVSLGAAGRKVIFNESSVQRARRFAGQLLPVPDLPGLPSGALEPLILRHSDAQRLDPRLVRAIIQVESGYNHRARSNRGAIGLMQLMPDTAAGLAVSDPYDVGENLRGGTTYLRQLIDAFPSSLEMAIAAYNAGPGAVERHRGVPPYPETVDYVQRVLALFRGAPGVVMARAAGTVATPGAAGPYLLGRRPAPRAPYVTRGANGRLVMTTSLAGVR